MKILKQYSSHPFYAELHEANSKLCLGMGKMQWNGVLMGIENWSLFGVIL